MRVVCSFMSLEVEYLQIEKDKSDVVLHRTRIFSVVGKMSECLLDVLTFHMKEIYLITVLRI